MTKGKYYIAHFPNRYLLNKENLKDVHLAETSTRISIDELDKKILSLLSQERRISYVDIAQQVEESAKVVAYRVKRLGEKGFTLGYRPIINHTLLGYTWYKIFLHLNKISKKDLSELKFHIRKYLGTIYLVEGIGLPGDLDIEMIIASNQELFRFMENLRFKFPNLIGEYQTSIFLYTLKVKYLPF